MKKYVLAFSAVCILFPLTVAAQTEQVNRGTLFKKSELVQKTDEPDPKSKVENRSQSASNIKSESVSESDSSKTQMELAKLSNTEIAGSDPNLDTAVAQLVTSLREHTAKQKATKNIGGKAQ